MVSSQVQRTLVKSPPELWAELSNPAALARHLGELGEIRITATKPEERVEWEADDASGTVLIKSSGWGTKVTLSATREVSEPARDSTEQPHVEATSGEEPAVIPADPLPATVAAEPDEEAQSPSAEIEPRVATDSEPEADATLTTEVLNAEPAPTSPQHIEVEARPGFFARLFRRRKKTAAAHPIADKPAEIQPMPAAGPGPETVAAAEPEGALESEPIACEEPKDAAPKETLAQPKDISAELKAAEKVTAEEVTALLTAVLDRLGAAHHRPFSRS